MRISTSPFSSLFALLILLCLIHFTSLTSAWKKEEFRNCNQTPFCKRPRSRTPGSCSLIATDVSISDGDLVAKLVVKKNGTEEEEEEEKPLVLRLSVFKGGILRFKVDDDQSLNPVKKRFEVPDVVVSEFLNEKLWLQRVEEEKVDGSSGVLSVVYLNDEYEGVIRHDPFEVYVRQKGSKKSVISVNSHGLFDFEQLRVKEGRRGEGGEHTDSRSFGPQSISFDVSFDDADFVYGIPEHATSLALKPTKGPGVEESEPYRLFNLDVFEYIHDSPFGTYGSIPFMLSHGKSRGSSGFSG